jgi:hypothetical protein
VINLSNLFTEIEIKDTRFYDKREYFTFTLGTFHLYVVNVITPGFGGLLLSHLIFILFCDVTVFVL